MMFTRSQRFIHCRAHQLCALSACMRLGTWARPAVTSCVNRDGWRDDALLRLLVHLSCINGRT